jgi:Zn-finger protein
MRKSEKSVWMCGLPGESIFIEFSPKQWPVPKKCHFHIGVAGESCPRCGSVVMMYYAVTSHHKADVFGNHAAMASCVNCNWVGFSPEVMKKVNETYDKLEGMQKQMEQLQKLGEVKPRKNIGEV